MKKLQQGQAMLRLFGGVCVPTHLRIAAHHELAGRDEDKIQVDRGFDG